MPRHLRPALAVLLVSLVLSGCSLLSPEDPETSARQATSAAPTPTETGPAPIDSAFFGVHDHDPVGEAAGGWPDGPVGSMRAWDAAVTWRDIEPAPGQYEFGRLDALVDTAEQNDSDVLLVLGQTPAFHAVDPAAESFYGEGASSPPKIAAWKMYVRTVAERYAGRPVLLQVWNEANVSGFWSGTPQEMAELTKAAHDAIADVDPRPTLVSPALVTRLSGQRKWIDEFYASTVEGAPVADYVDVVSLQLYPEEEGTPESSMELLAAMRTVLEEHGVDKPIWNTEINYGLTGLEVEPAPTKEQQANVAQTFLLNAANGVERVYWYGWDQQTIVDTLLTEPDGATVTPAGEAFGTVREWLVGSVVTSCAPDADGTYTCVLEGEGGASTVFWNPQGSATVDVPEGATTVERIGGRDKPVPADGKLSVGPLPVRVDAAG